MVIRSRRDFPLLLLTALILSGCDQTTSSGDNRTAKPKHADVLEHILRTGELVVTTRNGSTTYYEGRDGPDGYEHALTQSFAQWLGVSVRYEVQDSIPEMLGQLTRGEAHLAAAALTRTEGRMEDFLFGPEYKQVEQLVVCDRGGKSPKNLSELPFVELMVLEGSSYDERLSLLERELPNLTWKTTSEWSTDEILTRVAEGKVECAVADSNIVAINRRYHPDLEIALSISDQQELAWALPLHATALQEKLREWFAAEGSEVERQALDERYYGHVPIFDYVDLKRYQRRIQSRLPRYRAIFEEAAQVTGLSWSLLAAVSYQESHWDPRARSPTGVRGMMMLTQLTAKSLGVTDRLDPTQSIMGGAKYLSRLRERVTEEVLGPDRDWFALAAYNVGYGHVQDARTLAQQLDKDPNKWYSVKKVLPLLSRKKFYRTLKHGYARGSEPVTYVERIRHYHDVLERQLAKATVTSTDSSLPGDAMADPTPKDIDTAASLPQIP